MMKTVEFIPDFRDSFPRPLCGGVSEHNTKRVLDGIGFPAALRRGVPMKSRSGAVAKQRQVEAKVTRIIS
jgi:hypothetical protein